MVVVEELDTPSNGSPTDNRPVVIDATCQPVSSSFSRTSSSRTPSPGARSDSWASRQSPRTHTPPVMGSSAGTIPSSGAKLEQTIGRHDVSLNVLQRLEAFAVDISQLRRVQEQWSKKHDDAEVFRRGQIDSISDRIFQVEKKLRKTEEEQQEAIDKASLTFQKNFQEVQQDRHNMLAAINQVNQNFERVSIDMGEQRVLSGVLQQDVCNLQQSLEWLSNDSRTKSMSVAAIQQSLATMDIALKSQEQQLQELQASAQAMRDKVMQTTPQSSFAESEERHRRLADKFAEVHNHVATLAAQMAKVDIDLHVTPTSEATKPQEVLVEVLQSHPTPSVSDTLQASQGKQTKSCLQSAAGEVGAVAALRVMPPPPPPISLRAEVAVDVEAPGGAVSPIGRLSTSATTAAALSQTHAAEFARGASQEPLGRSCARVPTHLPTPVPTPLGTMSNSASPSEACSPQATLSSSCRWRGHRQSDETFAAGNGQETASRESTFSGACPDDVGTIRMQPSGAQTVPNPGMPFLGSASLSHSSGSRTRPSTPARSHPTVASNGCSTSATAVSSHRGASPTPTRPNVARSTPNSAYRVVDAPSHAQSPHSMETDLGFGAWCSRSAGQRSHAHANALVSGHQDWNSSFVGTAAFDRHHLAVGAHSSSWHGSVQIPARSSHGPMPSAGATAFGPMASPSHGGSVGLVQRPGPVRTRSLSAATRTGHPC